MFIRIVLVLLVLSWSVGLAQAEWEKLTDSPNFGGFIVYVETTSFRIDKRSGLVKMWILYDFKTSQEGYQVPYLSMRSIGSTPFPFDFDIVCPNPSRIFG